MTTTTQLKPTLGTLHLWGIAVGLVISGEYFGWSYGWGTAGTLGFLVTALMVATMYTCFIFSFTELTTAIPTRRRAVCLQPSGVRRERRIDRRDRHADRIRLRSAGHCHGHWRLSQRAIPGA
jgi:hypothetical protein